LVFLVLIRTTSQYKPNVQTHGTALTSFFWIMEPRIR